MSINLQRGKLPTAEEMKFFSSGYSMDDWKTLCRNKIFMELVQNDLVKCALCAELLLDGKYINDIKDVVSPKVKTKNK